MNVHELERAARVMHALAHPLRLGILQVLSEDECCVTELYEKLDCNQSTMSQHLRILEEQGLILRRRDGANRICSIRNPDILKLFECMKSHIDQIFKL
ncbi:MAG: helix-turn-helix transcriptional regulator [Planctomycetes bacterium]|nr:helix-turn-helix transcriptional regulator [Planctomycetota bacterium]